MGAAPAPAAARAPVLTAAAPGSPGERSPLGPSDQSASGVLTVRTPPPGRDARTASEIVLPTSRAPWAVLALLAVVLAGAGVLAVRGLRSGDAPATPAAVAPLLPPLGGPAVAAEPALPQPAAEPAAERLLALAPTPATQPGPPVVPPLPAAAPAREPTAPQAERLSATRAPAPSRPARPALAPHPVRREPARLTVRAPHGWAKVWVNGLGPFMAPFRDRVAPAGRVSLRFESPRGEQSMQRQAEPGEGLVVSAP